MTTHEYTEVYRDGAMRWLVCQACGRYVVETGDSVYVLPGCDGDMAVQHVRPDADAARLARWVDDVLDGMDGAIA